MPAASCSGLDSAKAVRGLSRRSTTSLSRNGVGALDGVLIAQQISDGIELVLGAHRDPEVGPVILFGAGGVELELTRDVALAAPPLDERHGQRPDRPHARRQAHRRLSRPAGARPQRAGQGADRRCRSSSSMPARASNRSTSIHSSCGVAAWRSMALLCLSGKASEGRHAARRAIVQGLRQPDRPDFRRHARGLVRLDPARSSRCSALPAAARPRRCAASPGSKRPTPA